MGLTRRSRTKPAVLLPSMQRHLSAYGIAASAAGVSLLALTPASEAKVVYTPAHELIGPDGSYKLDLNNDGIIDFVIVEIARHSQLATSQFLSARGRLGNEVNCASSFCGSEPYAAALTRGKQIGPNLGSHGWIKTPTVMAFEIFSKQGSYYGFAWANVSDRYLGLKFRINGETHFGWARLNVKLHKGAPKDRTWEVQLTGYAYETVAGKPIQAGQTIGDAEDVSASPQTAQSSTPMVASSASRRASRFMPLGVLALGASGIALWRRDDS
jgi:hypothetical protein